MRLKPGMPKSQKITLTTIVIGSLVFLGVLLLGGMEQGKLFANILGWAGLLFVVSGYVVGWKFSLTEDDVFLVAEDRQKYNKLMQQETRTAKDKRFIKNYINRREQFNLQKIAYITKAYVNNEPGEVSSVLVSTVPHEFSKSSHKLTKENVVVFAGTLLDSLPATFDFLDKQKQLIENEKLFDVCIELVVFGKQSVSDISLNLSPETVEKAVVVRPQSLHVHYLVFSTPTQIEQFKQSMLKNLKTPHRNQVANKVLTTE